MTEFIEGTTIPRVAKRGKQHKVPTNPFRLAVYNLLGGAARNTVVSANILGLTPQLLNRFLKNADHEVTQAWLAKRDWEDVFKKYCSGNWEKYGKDYLAAKAGLPLKCRLSQARLKSANPVVKIIGADTAAVASEKLGVSVKVISTLRNSERISQAYLAKLGFSEKLQKGYPAAFQQYQKEYDAWVETLSANGWRGVVAPDDKSGLPHVLWRIGGGKGFVGKDMAQCLGIDQRCLSRLMHGHHSYAQRYIRDNSWAQKLAGKYPEGWARDAAAFEIAVSALNVSVGKHDRSKKKAPQNGRGTVRNNWRLAAADFVKRALATKEISLEAIVERVGVKYLQSLGTWSRLLDAPPELGAGLYREALTEVCRILDIPRTSKLGNQAEKIRAKIDSENPTRSGGQGRVVAEGMHPA